MVSYFLLNQRTEDYSFWIKYSKRRLFALASYRLSRPFSLFREGRRRQAPNKTRPKPPSKHKPRIFYNIFLFIVISIQSLSLSFQPPKIKGRKAF